MQREPTKKAIYERKVINRDGSNNFLPVEIGVQKVLLPKPRKIFLYHIFISGEK